MQLFCLTKHYSLTGVLYTLIMQTSLCFVVLQDLVEGLWEDVSLKVCILDSEQEIEIVGLLIVLIIALGYDSHHFAEIWYIFD